MVLSGAPDGDSFFQRGETSMITYTIEWDASNAGYWIRERKTGATIGSLAFSFEEAVGQLSRMFPTADIREANITFKV